MMVKAQSKKNIDQRSWYLLDFKNKTLGRESTKIASILQGKHLTKFNRSSDCGENVIVINAAHFTLTGSKMDNKVYYKHTGYIGNLKKKTLKEYLKSPCEIVKKSVSGMLPKNLLRDNMLKRLHIYEGNEHPHKNIKDIKTL
jgi:large subunit ribosomal protein L13